MTRITYYGHSCFGITAGSKEILVDPFISANPLAKSIDVTSIKPDIIFLTHGHADHVADVTNVATKDTPVITNFEIANWFTAKGLNAVGMNHGGIWKDTFGQVRMVPAQHTSSLPDGTYGGTPSGLVFSTSQATIYLAGDTCLTMDMKLIPLLDGPIDCAILPIGGHFTMAAQEAVQAAKFVQCNRVIGCHFDTFPPIQIDHRETKDLFEQADIQLTLPSIGEVIEFG